MSFVSKVTSFFGGSIFKEIKEIGMAYFPPDMSPEQKAKAELALTQALHEKQLQATQLANEAEAEFNARIKDMEGTAGDLKQMPIVGPLMIFLRGCQRPIWSFGTMYMDILWLFSEKQFSLTQEKTLLFVNVIVLIFLFGERAIKNAMPVVTSFFESRRNNVK